MDVPSAASLPPREPLNKYREPRCELVQIQIVCRQAQSEGRSLIYEAEDWNDAADDSGRNPSGRG